MIDSGPPVAMSRHHDEVDTVAGLGMQDGLRYWAGAGHDFAWTLAGIRSRAIWSSFVCASFSQTS
jgi:hypothetical protein